MIALKQVVLQRVAEVTETRGAAVCDLVLRTCRQGAGNQGEPWQNQGGCCGLSWGKHACLSNAWC